MKTSSTKICAIHLVLVCTLLRLFTGCATTNDVNSQARSKLGTIPASHPERGLGSLQGYKAQHKTAFCPPYFSMEQ
jgi:hypothetical protein